MTGFAWLNELMLWLGKWFPRLVLVKAGNAAVWFGPNGRTRALSSGLYCYWPITTEITIVSTRLRTTEIASQLCGREAISLCVQYTIRDPLVAVLKFNDVFSQLDDRTQGHLSTSYDPSLTNAAICDAVQAGLHADFSAHGVEVHSVRVVGRGRVIPLKNLNDWANHAKAQLC